MQDTLKMNPIKRYVLAICVCERERERERESPGGIFQKG